MAKPVINKIIPFDVSKGTIINFKYEGNQPYGNILNIYRNYDLELIYTDTVDNMKLSHTIPPNCEGLSNGEQYAAEIITIDKDGNQSISSAKSFFWTLTAPTFEFNGINEGDVIENASLDASLTYYQADGDRLDENQFLIYNAQKVLLTQSDVFYGGETLSYNFKGLENNTEYYIRAVGLTIKELRLDTGYIRIFVQYEEPHSYARIYVDEKDTDGVVDYFTNLSVIESKREDYEYSNGFINLTGDTLVYDDQFIIKDDFTMAIRHMYILGDLLKCRNEKSGFTLQVYKGEDSTYRYKLIAPNSVCNYVLYSNPFTYDLNTVMTVWIRRIGGLYQLWIFDEGSTDVDAFNLWLTETHPDGGDYYDLWINTDDNTYIMKNNVKVWEGTSEPTNAEQHNIWIGGTE